MQAVILAAGRGVRLKPHTDSLPKGLLPIAGKPLLEYTIDSLPDSITEIVFVIGYRGDQIRNYFGSIWNGKPVRYTTQDSLNGTGSAMYQAKNLLGERFLVVNGDDIYAKKDLEELITHVPSLLVHEEEGIVSHSIIEDETHRLIGLAREGVPDKPNLRICGAYMLDRSFFDYPLAEITVRGSVEYTLPHTLIEMAHGKEIVVQRATFWHQVGTPEQYKAIQRIIASRYGARQ